MKECLKAKTDELETSSKFKISETCVGVSGTSAYKWYSKGWEEWFGYRMPQYFGLMEEAFLSVIACTWG